MTVEGRHAGHNFLPSYTLPVSHLLDIKWTCENCGADFHDWIADPHKCPCPTAGLKRRIEAAAMRGHARPSL